MTIRALIQRSIDKRTAEPTADRTDESNTEPTHTMRYRAHDLLRVDTDLIHLLLDPAISRPEWVDGALLRAPWVVVRRASPLCEHPQSAGAIPVGVRGTRRTERYGLWIDPEHVRACVPPEHLVAMAVAPLSATDDVPAVALARALVPVFERLGLAWGPTGSVGFEWASGVRTAHATSDLDLIIRCDQPLPRTTAAAMLQQWERLADAYGSCRIDANVETPSGAFSLTEYATAEGAILLRTPRGPQLTHDVWKGTVAQGATAVEVAALDPASSRSA